jgi:hypothetical protein
LSLVTNIIVHFCLILPLVCNKGAGGAQYSVWLDNRGSIPCRNKEFFLYPLCSDQSEIQPASYPMGIGGPFLGGKARPGRDADHSPTSSAEVKNE